MSLTPDTTRPPAAPRPLATPNVTRHMDQETGTMTHTYQEPVGGLIIASMARKVRTGASSLYLHSYTEDWRDGTMKVEEDVPELVAVSHLRQHLEAQGYALSKHPLSD